MDNVDFTRGNRARTLEEDPQYFGGYLNMARHNIFNISNHLAARVDQPLLEEESHIANSFLRHYNDKKLNWNLVYSMLVRFMPGAKVFHYEDLPLATREAIKEYEGIPKRVKDFERMSKMLGVVFKELRDFRNDYSHYGSTDDSFSRKISISRDFAWFLQRAYGAAIDFTKLRMKGVLRDEDFYLAQNRKLLQNENEITADGLVFLTCMFLEREYAFQFIGKIKGLKGTQNSSFQATREVFMAFCVKLPHDKFVSEDIKQSLQLDMINELNRCPKVLYNVITEEAKQPFLPQLEPEKASNIIDSSNMTDESEEWEESVYEEYIERLTKRVRHENRFSYHAMRFIDEMGVFERLSFHLNLGKIELKSYPKTIAGIEDTRRIVDDVKAFGKLSDFMDRDSVVKRVGKEFEQFRPHYHAVNNKIGLHRKPSVSILKDRLIHKAPEAFLSLHELPKIILLEYLMQGEAEKIIHDFLGVNSRKLLTKAFILEVKSKLPGEWQALRKRCRSKDKVDEFAPFLKEITSRKTQLNDVLKEHGLDDSQIPSQILDFWLNSEEAPADVLFAERIKSTKNDCKQRLKALDRNDKDARKRIPKVGEMATFLAQDMVDMLIEEKAKEKVTSFYYGKLQECLALYADGEKRRFFHELIKELGLLKEDGHPFLGQVLQRRPMNTISFYRIYLSEKAHKPEGAKHDRSSWLYRTFYFTEWNETTKRNDTVIEMPKNTTNIPLTIRKWRDDKNKSWEGWLDRVSGKKRKPVDLPTNLFDSRIHELLREEVTKAGVAFDDSLKGGRLIKKWWETRNDSVQDFYHAEREYQVYDEVVRFIPDSSDHFSEYYNHAFRKVDKKHRKGRIEPTGKELERIFKRTIAGTERDLRVIQEEDQLLLLMIESMMKGDANYSESMENVRLSNVEKLLNETIPISLNLSFDSSKTIVTQSKRKNYTQLRKYLYDRRIPGLVAYHEGKQITLEWLKRELFAYNNAKQTVFDLLFELEEAILGVDRAGVDALFMGDDGMRLYGNIQHRPYLKWLLSNGLISEKDKEFMRRVRNSFSHNEFPPKEVVAETLALEAGQPVAEQILTAYERKVRVVINKLSA